MDLRIFTETIEVLVPGTVVPLTSGDGTPVMDN